MTRSFASLRRTAALSVTITFFAASIASAQSPEAVPAIGSPANTVLLTDEAFARLVQPLSADIAPAAVLKSPARLDLLRQATAATVREARATPTKAPQQRSWISRNKAPLAWAIVLGVIASSLIWFVTCDGCGE